MKKTKIICTMGPNSDDREVMKQLLLNGMDVARFNFRRFDDNHADVSHAEQRDCQNYAYDKLQELLLVEFVFFLFVMFLTAVVR